MASRVRQYLVVALSVVVLSPFAVLNAQDNPLKPMFSAPGKAREVAKEESSRAYKGDEEAPAASAPAASTAVFSPAWQRKLETELKKIESDTGATLSSTRPFADIAGMKANMNKPAWSWNELSDHVRPDPKNAGQKCAGRAIMVEGTVLSVKPSGSTRVLMVGDPGEQMDRVAIVILPVEDNTPYKVGDHFSDLGVYILHASKKGEKQDAFVFATLPTKAQMSPQGAPSASPSAPAAAPAAEKGEFTDALNGWRLVGVVSDDQGGVGVFVNKDGRKIFARTGHKIEKGIELVGLVDGQARLMVGKKQFDIWPW